MTATTANGKERGKSSTPELQNHAKFINSRFQTLAPEDSTPQQCGICSLLWLCLPGALLFASSVLVKSSNIFSSDFLPRLSPQTGKSNDVGKEVYTFIDFNFWVSTSGSTQRITLFNALRSFLALRITGFLELNSGLQIPYLGLRYTCTHVLPNTWTSPHRFNSVGTS